MINNEIKENEIKNKHSTLNDCITDKPQQVKEGRIFIYLPNHPHANNRGYVRRARYVMETKIGRTLESYEIVHHINKNKADDRIENLMLVNKGEHAMLHNNSNPKNDVIPIRTGPLPQYIKNHLDNLKSKGEMGEWVRNAMIKQYAFENNPKSFLMDIIRNNYYLVRRLLRIAGTSK